MPCTTCEDSGMIYEGSVDSDVNTDVDNNVDSNDGDATTSDEAMGECDNCGGRGIEGMPCTTCEDSGMIYG